MIGIGVGIDYSLFIVTRFRQLLHDGLPPREAAAEAGASAGRAVLFAGLTVAISVTGLAFIGLDFVTKLGIGSALGVLTTVLLANSLLPAVLALLGHRIDRLKVPFLRPLDDSEAARDSTLIARWGRFVTRNAESCSSSLGACSLLLALADRRLVRLGAADAGHGAQGADDRRGVRPAPRASAPASTARSRSSSTASADKQAAQQDLRRRQSCAGTAVAFVSEPQLQQGEDVAIVVRHADHRAAGRGDGRPVVDAARRHRPQGDRRRRRASRTSRGQTAAFKDIADRIISRGCRCSCSTSSASRSSCWRWRSGRS